MDFVRSIAIHAWRTGFLSGSVRLQGGQPRIVGRTPWDEYRGNLESRIGLPDHEGLQAWISQEGFDMEPGVPFGPLTLHRVFHEIARIHEFNSRMDTVQEGRAA